jgi:hypothetical protein
MTWRSVVTLRLVLKRLYIGFVTIWIILQTDLLRSSKWGKWISFLLCHLVFRLITDEKSRFEQLKFQMEIFGNECLLIERHTPPLYLSLSLYLFRLDNWINVRDRLFDWNLPQSTVLLIKGLYKEQISIHRATIQWCLRRPTLECNALYTLTVGTKVPEKGVAPIFRVNEAN